MLGKEILGYHVDEKIGSGGFGTVYKVSKTNVTGTYVRALKHIEVPTKRQYVNILNSMGGDSTKADDYFANILKNIVGEIKILSALSESGNQNIVRYYENDVIETHSPKKYDIYILMEYLTPFPEYLDDISLTVKDVIKLGKDILNALIACHGRNIIHRDIKDDNIFVASDGTYKIGDFGVSKALKDQSRAASIKGTPNFIAPEVYLGKDNYDHTVDLYSLGIVLYRLLNNLRNPFLPAFPNAYTSEDEDIAFEARMTGKIPELPNMAKNELGEAILKAIKPRNERYNTAKEFLDALEKAEKTLAPIYLAQGIGIFNASQESEETVAFSNMDADVTIAASMASGQAEVQNSNDDSGLFKTIGLFSDDADINQEEVEQQEEDANKTIALDNDDLTDNAQSTESDNTDEEDNAPNKDNLNSPFVEPTNKTDLVENKQKNKKSKKAIIIIAIVALLLIILIAGIIFAINNNLSKKQNEVETNINVNTGIPAHTHVGGIKECETTAICTICGTSYEHLQEVIHSGKNVWERGEFSHYATYSCCGEISVQTSEHEWKDGKCSVCGYKCNHIDYNMNHDCDECGVNVGVHSDSTNDGNHKCDYCGSILTSCADTNKDHSCDDCGTYMGTHSDSSNDGNHNCDYCNATLTSCTDANKDHGCDECGAKISNCADTNKDHICDYCQNTVYSEGLEFAEWATECVVYGIGTCTDAEIYIPATYNDLPVRYIGYGAFEGNNLISKVVIPNSVIGIEHYAFKDCTNLKSVVLHEGLEYIEDDAFCYCISLESIVLPDSLNYIGRSVFCNCENLKNIVLPDNLNHIGQYVLDNTGYFNNELNWQNNVLYNGNYLLGARMTELVGECKIKSGTKVVAESAFSGCDELISVIIPDSVTFIVGDTFFGCDKLSNIDVDINNVSYKSVDGNLYSKDGKTLIGYAIGKTATSFTIPDSVTSIGDWAFAGCTNLTSVTIGNNVTSIGSSAFADCTSLTSVTIGNNVTSIGSFAFADCTSLTSVTIGNNVTSVGDCAFYNCDGLTSVTIGNSVTNIGYNAFYDCDDLTSVTIGNSVTSIGYAAFEDCTSLTSVKFTNAGGWKADDTTLSSSDLSNSSTAAQYLRETYCNSIWTRS